ncbi:hypothetical protein R3P38DRAFT_1631063 [Favolaschia claudopus]|uniref:Uncharacterized protein n=1 Tax=Favolaschia claudopus TaxID=2862362 RepID=A0AAW0DKQ7_9AGAR
MRAWVYTVGERGRFEGYVLCAVSQRGERGGQDSYGGMSLLCFLPAIRCLSPPPPTYSLRLRLGKRRRALTILSYIGPTSLFPPRFSFVVTTLPSFHYVPPPHSPLRSVQTVLIIRCIILAIILFFSNHLIDSRSSNCKPESWHINAFPYVSLACFSVLVPCSQFDWMIHPPIGARTATLIKCWYNDFSQ